MKKEVFTQNETDFIDVDWYFDNDGFYGHDGKNGIVIGGNRDYTKFFYVEDYIKETILNDILLTNPENVRAYLEEATGKSYATYCMRGYTQSDWQYAFYPVDDFSKKVMEEITDFYFGNVTEWTNKDTVYTIPDSEIDKKKWLSEATGIDVNNIILKQIKGYKKVAIYEEV